ncbi:MAG: DNA repair protein RadA [Bacteroidia bacterium]
MSKLKTVYVCQQCGAQSPKWVGKCSSCGSWNSFVEEIREKAGSSTDARQFSGKGARRQSEAQLLSDVASDLTERWHCPDAELNRVLGGGLVPGALILLGGEPGIGKSTLLLQLALQLSDYRILYVSGEESEAQIKLRASRLGLPQEHCYVLTETDTTAIFRQVEAIRPNLLIVDSIQTVYSPLVESAPGSVSQIRQAAGEFMRFAKENRVPTFLIGHITKDGQLAGPKVLEHLVDTVLQFEGDRNHSYRIVRTLKNRFGSTSELGIYDMQGAGLREVSNPSELLLTRQWHQQSGMAIGSTREGNRSLFVEVQALAAGSAFGTPQRSTTGFEQRRLNMLIAVLEKRCGYRLNQMDVFLNIAGGLRVEDPAIDLAVCAALASSLQDLPLSGEVCFAAEIGLGGELRPVSQIENRLAEAVKLGFSKIFLSEHQQIQAQPKDLQLIRSGRLDELIGKIF